MLWSYCTTAKISTEETPFSLAFGVEAVMPLEIRISSSLTAVYNEIENEKAVHGELDLVEERKNGAKLKKCYLSITTRMCENESLRSVPLFWEKKILTTIGIDLESLRPNWKWPYRVTKNPTQGSLWTERYKMKALCFILGTPSILGNIISKKIHCNM